LKRIIEKRAKKAFNAIVPVLESAFHISKKLELPHSMRGRKPSSPATSNTITTTESTESNRASAAGQPTDFVVLSGRKRGGETKYRESESPLQTCSTGNAPATHPASGPLSQDLSPKQPETTEVAIQHPSSLAPSFKLTSASPLTAPSVFVLFF
jgi:hypothetical protein